MKLRIAYGWQVIYDGEQRHVVPTMDLREHAFVGCWCHPEEDNGVIVHNSGDQREAFERGERQPS